MEDWTWIQKFLGVIGIIIALWLFLYYKFIYPIRQTLKLHEEEEKRKSGEKEIPDLESASSP